MKSTAATYHIPSLSPSGRCKASWGMSHHVALCCMSRCRSCCVVFGQWCQFHDDKLQGDVLRAQLPTASDSLPMTRHGDETLQRYIAIEIMVIYGDIIRLDLEIRYKYDWSQLENTFCWTFSLSTLFDFCPDPLPSNQLSLFITLDTIHSVPPAG